MQSRTSPKLRIRAQGQLLTVKAEIGVGDKIRGTGARGDVEDFSDASRLRLFKLLATLKTPESKGYRSKVSFLTLTTRQVLHPRDFKHKMQILFKRLTRRYPKTAVIWRLEYQKRGAPHAHCILYNAPYINKEDLQKVWSEITGEEQPFTRIELVRAYRQLCTYAAKYIAKSAESGFNIGAYLTALDETQEPDTRSPGRIWGIWNRQALPYADQEEIVVPFDGSFYMIRAYCSKFYSHIMDYPVASFTVFCDDPYQALQYCQKLSDYWIAEEKRKLTGATNAPIMGTASAG